MLKELVSDNSAEVVPKEWKTTREWAKIEKTGLVQTSNYLRRGVALDLIEMKKFRISLSGVVRPVPHYKIK